MQKKLMWLILYSNMASWPLLASSEPTPKASITFTLPGGRLGNNLIALAKAIYVSYTRNLRLLIPPFKYSNEFVFSKNEQIFMAGDEKKFKHIYQIKNVSEVMDPLNPEILYVSDFNLNINLPHCVRIDDGFRNILRSLINPIQRDYPPNIPKDNIVIGIHIRTGGTYDRPRVIEKLPHKFPPIERYVIQLKRLLSQIRIRPVHVHIFTDNSEPEKLADIFKQSLGHMKITFSYRNENNHHDAHVLEDLFAMADCDYLIRPHSTYSIIAEIIGSHKRIMRVRLR